MIATLAAMLRDERGSPLPFRGASAPVRGAQLQFNGGAFPVRGTPTLYPTLLQALKDGYQVYNQAPGVYFLRQRFADGWKFAQVVSGGRATWSPPLRLAGRDDQRPLPFC